MKKVMVVFGTRPEAIKMCPLIKELYKRKNIKTIVCVTGQHKEMLDQVLAAFQVNPDYNLNIMKENQTLFDITISIMDKIKNVLIDEKPDVVLVHGDTTTTFGTALAAYYMNIKIGHVEAGLRTYNVQSPYPEEFNRQAVSIIADFNFAPTKFAADNLLREVRNEESIFITGNTGIDSLNYTISSDYSHKEIEWAKDSKMILLTAHRRENLGTPMERMFHAINKVVEENKDIKVIYPIHKNQKVRDIANSILGKNNRIHIIEPLGVLDFHNFLSRSYLILTDSGGIQEEATALGKPVLIMRDTTERQEGVEAGNLKLVGTDEERIYEEFSLLLKDKNEFLKMCRRSSIYGEGNASKKIVDILVEKLV